MIVAVWKLIIFTSTMYRQNTSRNERVTPQVWYMPANVPCVHPSSHGKHRGDGPFHALFWSASQLLSSQVRQVCSSNQVCSRVVAQTLCPSRIPKVSSYEGLNRGTVQALDKASSPYKHPAQSIGAEERSTTDERLDKNAGGHPAAEWSPLVHLPAF